LSIFIGDAVETVDQLELDRESKELTPVSSSPGDELVTRSSALMDERVGSDWKPMVQSPIKWDKVFFVFNDHIGLTKDPAFADNLLFYLLEYGHQSPDLTAKEIP